MVAEIGHFALIVAFSLAIVQSVVPLVGARFYDAHFMGFGSNAAVGQAGFTALAFACLTYSFVSADYSVSTVASHSNSSMPLLYKVTAVWGNHEGSMVLWVLILALFGAAVAVFGGNLPVSLKARVLAVQGMIGAGFLMFVLFASNPFSRLNPAPLDGNDLNPLLQDIGLAIHPPFLYLGYVGFSIVFSFCVAALLEGRVDAGWARWVRPWVLASWCFLTIGITLGSYWAYYELGWGGWWFWDPVENASFMPWLLGTALLHSALVVERRQALVNWTVLLGILTFSLSLVGTFLVRSGVLTSVHAFAQDPTRGVFVLALLAVITGGALTLYACKASSLVSGAPFATVSRESGLVLNNVLLVSAAGTVFLGTFYPLIIDALGNDKISVGPPYYYLTFVPIFIPLLIVMAAGPLVKWKRDNLRRVFSDLRFAAIAAAVLALGVAVATWGGHAFAALGLALALWLVVSTFWMLARRIRLGRASLKTVFKLARTTPRSVYGLVLAHAGMGVAVAGITAMTAWQSEQIGKLPVSGSMMLAGYRITLVSVSATPGPNYRAQRAVFDVTEKARPVATMFSERRFYPVRRSQTTEAGIHATALANIYIAIGERNEQGALTVRAYYHPLAIWIWLGPLIMALGGLISLTDRRLRIGMPRRARRASPAPMPAGEPELGT